MKLSKENYNKVEELLIEAGHTMRDIPKTGDFSDVWQYIEDAKTCKEAAKAAGKEIEVFWK